MTDWDRLAGRLARGLNWAAMASIIGMMALTALDVVLRPLGLPLVGAYELAGFLGGLAVSLALAETTYRKGHVEVEIVTERLSAPLRNAIGVVTRLLSLGVFVLISWQSARYASVLRASGEVSMTLGLRFYPVVYAVAFSFAAAAFVVGVDLLRSPARTPRRDGAR